LFSHIEMVTRLILAAAMSGVIGFERERLLWAAGLRTHMLVCVGSCLIMLVSAFGFSDVLGKPDVVLDPSRVAAQVVSGISFIGAGTILLRGEVVKGLTTPANLWAVAAIGLAVGGGLYVAAIATTALVIGILLGLKPLSARLHSRLQSKALLLTVRRGAVSIETIHDVSGARSSRVQQFVVRPTTTLDEDEVRVSFVRLSQASVDAIAQRLRDKPGVIRVADANIDRRHS
jgi:putative Mg2+ transporter-C (MgtC) family protein